MPISEPGGRLLYALTRAARPATVVEFGTSFGISTAYLAAAVTDNGSGHVLTTELSPVKIAAAQANLEDAGLADVVTSSRATPWRPSPAFTGPVGLVFLDGWKDLCLPVLRLLEPGSRPARWSWPTTSTATPAWPTTWRTSATRPTGTSRSRSRSRTAWR